jgi:hypothetical protein
MKSTVPNAATSSNLKGKPMTKTIGLHWLQQVTKHVPATDEASIYRAQLRVKPLYYCRVANSTYHDVSKTYSRLISEYIAHEKSTVYFLR